MGVEVKQVDVIGLMGALRTKGKAKLSDFAEPISETNNNSTNNSKNSETMAETKSAQEYVGKVIIVGENIATIEIKGVQDNGMLAGEFRKGDAAPIAMPVTIPNLEAMMKRGVWRFADATETKSEDEVQEVEDVQPTPKTEPKATAKTVEMPNAGESKPKRKPKTKAESAGKLPLTSPRQRNLSPRW